MMLLIFKLCNSAVSFGVQYAMYMYMNWNLEWSAFAWARFTFVESEKHSRNMHIIFHFVYYKDTLYYEGNMECKVEGLKCSWVWIV